MSQLKQLESSLQAIIPSARLERVALPPASAPEPASARTLQLYLLNADYPQGELQPDEVQTVMNNPLYWVFCWASGQVLARQLLADPARVRGKRVLDFGCGCGVVAIAAALAGAAEVIACDIDPLALRATALNAQLNNVTLTLAEDFDSVAGPLDLILVADVLYDRGNFPWLERFVGRANEVLIADSRVKDFDFPPYRPLGRWESCTLPDLDESAQFRDVRLYRAGRGGGIFGTLLADSIDSDLRQTNGTPCL